MAKLNPISSHNLRVGYTFWCPGCKEVHVVYTHESQPIHWEFNEDVDKPTFKPSILRHESKTEPRCHSFVEDGKIRFLGDCEHDLKGQTVEIPEWKGWDEENYGSNTEGTEEA